MANEQPDIQQVFATLTAYQRTAILKAALELDVFAAIAAGASSAKEIGAAIRAPERGARILCNALVVLGFLTVDKHSYGLTATSQTFLDRKSPLYIGAAANFLAAPTLMSMYQDVAAAVRKGGTVISAEGSVAPENPMWVEFARSMSGISAVQSQLLANLVGAGGGEKWKVLDIAAGHGQYGIGIAKANPNAEIVAQDWANVLAVAEETARAAGVSERFRKLPGDAFKVDFGSGYDLVLLTNILHHFDPDTCVKLLRKVHAALKPGGRAVTLEFVPDESRISPPEAALFSITMLVSTPSGDAYTFSEFEKMFRQAGFARSELRDLAPTTFRVVLSYK